MISIMNEDFVFHDTSRLRFSKDVFIFNTIRGTFGSTYHVHTMQELDLFHT